MNRHTPIGARRDGLRNAQRNVQSPLTCPTGEAGAPFLPTDCSICEQPFDAGYCPRCEHFAHEMLPEKPLSQWKAEHPEIVAEIQAWIAECFPCRPDPFGGFNV